jgi:hypothetical protein
MKADPVIALAQRQRLEAIENAENGLAQQVVEALGYHMAAPPHGWENFAQWCKRYGVRHIPARPTTVAGFMLDSYRNGVAFDDITQQLEAIAAIHDVGLGNPVSTPIVAAALEAIAPPESIKPPISWSKDARADWWELPTWAKAIIERREKQRERQLSKRLTELSEERKKLDHEIQKADGKDSRDGAAEDTGDARADEETVPA